MDHERETYWPPKKAESGEQKYVLCYGDLHAHSILMHVETLHVMKVVDWGNAGYFHPEYQVYLVRRRDYEELFTNKKRGEKVTLSQLMV
jgi:hypothetical protein